MTVSEAMDRVRDEMAKPTCGQMVRYLGEGVTAMLQQHPEWAEQIGAKGKTLSGCMDAIKRGATGGVSDPVSSATAILKYYGIKADARRVALEVNRALMGEDEGTEMARGDAQAAAGDEAKGKREKGKGMAEDEAQARAGGFEDELDALLAGL